MTQQIVQNEGATNSAPLTMPPSVTDSVAVPAAHSKAADITPAPDAKAAAGAALAVSAALLETPQTLNVNYPKAAESQWKIFQTINEWIRFADIKAGALLTANGAALAALLPALKSNFAALPSNPLACILALISGAGMLASIGCCLWCIIPKTAWFHTRHDRASSSLIFFDHIAGMEQSAYQAHARAMGADETVYSEISGQVWINARVARDKHDQIKYAVAGLSVSIGAALLTVLLVGFR